MNIREALSTYNPNYWNIVINTEHFPIIKDVKAKITKLWMTVDNNNYIWIDGNNEKEAMERYIKCLDIITKKSIKELPHGLQKMIARVYVRYRLRPDLIDMFETKDGIGHASYNWERNSMRFVPEYFRRFGTIKFGTKMIPEFHKTCVHEYGHMLWHKWLNSDEKSIFFKLMPPFKKSKIIIKGWYRPSVVSLDGRIAESHFIVPVGTKLLSKQELLSPRECFAEDFAFYTVDPELLKNMFPKRYYFMEDIVDTDHRIVSSKDIKKVEVINDDDKQIKMTDLIPVDLQTNVHRISLANKFAQRLTVILNHNGILISDVVSVIPYGGYNSSEEEPEKIKCIVLVPGFPDKSLIKDHFVYEDDYVEIVVLKDEQKFNAFIYDKLELGSVARERIHPDIKKVTPIGQRVHKPHKTILTESDPSTMLPFGYVKAQLEAGGLKLDRPLNTKYVMHEHHADKAGKHIDFRIKVGDLAYSWVVPKGLPKKGERRLAILQPPHKVNYMSFVGTIPSGYGKGYVKIADAGPMEVKEWGETKKLFQILDGPNSGNYAMIQTKDPNNWIIVNVKRKPIDSQYKLKDYRMRHRKSMLTSRRYAVQPRFGGPKVLVYTGEKENRILTRTPSRKGVGYVERTDNYPHIRDTQLGKPGTVLEGELFANDTAISNGISISNPGAARRIQQEKGKATFWINDILAAGNDDLRHLPYRLRLRAIKHILPSSKYVKKVPSTFVNKKKAIEVFDRLGVHGVYIIDRKAPYYDKAGLYISTDSKTEKCERSDDIQKSWVSPKRFQELFTQGNIPEFEPKAGKIRPSLKTQYEPAKVRLKFQEKMWKDPKYILEPKLDGSRYLLYIGNKENRILSRQTSVKSDVGHVEKTDNVPHLRDYKFGIKDTILDGEIIRRDFNTTQRIMGSSPEVSHKLQHEVGKPIYIVYDILRYKGKDVRDLPFESRRKIIDRHIKVDNKNVAVTPMFEGKDKEGVYGELVQSGFEGVVLKDKTKPYNDKFMTKKKKLLTDEYVVMGFTEGTGRRQGKIGAIQIGKWDPKEKKLIPKGKVGTGLSDEDVDWWTKNKDKLIGQTVIEIKMMEKTHNDIPRSPVFMRIRNDKSPMQTI